MGTWQFVGGPATGGRTVSLAAAKNRKLTVRLSSPSEASFDIDGTHPDASLITELQSDLHVLFTPDAPGAATAIAYRGRIGPSTDQLDATAHTTSFSSLDYRELLRRRRLYAADTAVTAGYSAIDQGTIAWNLIQTTQGHPGGNLGISRGVGAVTGTPQTRGYIAGDTIGDKISELGQVLNGFEWDITPVSDSALNLDLWIIGGRGANRGVVIEYGGLAEKIRREFQTSNYANAIRVTGDNTGNGGVAPTPQERSVSDIATRPEGLWDLSVTAPTVFTLAALSSFADYKIQDISTLIPAYSITLRRGAWRGPQHIWLGDTILVDILSGRINETGKTYRVQEMAFVINEDGGGETVDLTIGRPPPNYHRYPAEVDRRLAILERR